MARLFLTPSRRFFLGGGAFTLACTLHHPKRAFLAVRTESSPRDLLIVGCGTLGSMAGAAWLRQHPGAVVVAETRSPSQHQELINMGFSPRCREDAFGVEVTGVAPTIATGSADPVISFSNVIFCVPPGKIANYDEEVRRAVELWNGRGAMVFTGSGGVFAEKDGGIVTEGSATADPPSERQQQLLAAEDVTLKAGGSVVRMAGLYSRARGAVPFWMKDGKVSGGPDGLVNLIHYEDAASLVVAVVSKQIRGELLLGCDDRALSRQEIVDAALALPEYVGQPVPQFNAAPVNRRTGRGADEKGKVYDNTETRKMTGWAPRWSTFAEWAVAQNVR